MVKEPIQTNKISLPLNLDVDGLSSIVDMVAAKLMEKLLPLINHPEEEDIIMDIKDLSRMIGKSTSQIYQWVHLASHGLGTFPFMKAGKSLRFSKKAVLEWMKRN